MLVLRIGVGVAHAGNARWFECARVCARACVRTFTIMHFKAAALEIAFLYCAASNACLYVSSLYVSNGRRVCNIHIRAVGVVLFFIFIASM